MKLETIISFYTDETNAGNFTQEQKESLISKANELYDIGVSIHKLKNTLDDYERLYKSYGGNWEQFAESFEFWKRSQGRQLEQVRKIGHIVIATGRGIKANADEIKRRIQK